MTDCELIDALLEERKQAAQRAKSCGKHPPSYYMININHPAIAGAYREWRNQKGLQFVAPSDRERTEFELSMLSPEGRLLLEQHMQKGLVGQ